MEERAGNLAIFAFAFVIVLLGVLSIIYGYHVAFETAIPGSYLFGAMLAAGGFGLNLWVYKSLNRADPEAMESYDDPLMGEIRDEIEDEIERQVARLG